MSDTTRAAFIKTPFQVKIETVAVPALAFDEVLLAVDAVGICGTDIHLAAAWATEWQRFGHETAGRVVRCGEGVTDLTPGDLVAVQATAPCGQCESCQNGDPRECLDWKRFRTSRAFADYVIVPRRTIWKITRLTPIEVTLIEPLSVALDLVRVADVSLGQSVAIVGPGPIGLMALKLCKLQGASRAFVFGAANDRDRFPLALDLGAEAAYDVTEVDPIAVIKAATKGRGVDRVLVTAPVHVMNQALDLARWGGIIAFLGFDEDPRQAIVPIDLNEFHFRRLQLRASYAAPATLFPLAEQLIADRQIDPRRFITHTFPLTRLTEALHLVAKHHDGVVKAVIVPNGRGEDKTDG